MAEVPSAMLREGRPVDGEFKADEFLYRRVSPSNWDGTEVELDAINLPDMSVLRAKYAHPEWARLEDDDYADWGVVGFRVREIPTNLVHLGVFLWTFEARHRPIKRNYPHSEVWAFEDGVHIDLNFKEHIDHAFHLRWRERLLRSLTVFVRPYQETEIRQVAPGE
jgi:hypothetical protein